MTTWSRTDTLDFIEHYLYEPRLWDPRNRFYRDENKANESWQTISASMNVPVDELKKKKDTLMKLYLLHKGRVNSSITRGDRGDDIYKPSWLYYDAMDAFLADIYQPGSNSQKKGLDCIDLTENELDGTAAEGPQKENPIPAVVTRTPPAPMRSNFQEARFALGPKPSCLSAPKRHSITSIQSDDTCEMDPAGLSSDETFCISIGDEECDFYVNLFGAKLKRFPEEQRIELMEEINELLTKKRRLMSRDSTFKTHESHPLLLPQ